MRVWNGVLWISVGCRLMAKGILGALGSALREAREGEGLTQQELGARSGVHRNYIGGIERGERRPTVAKIAELADALGMPMDELFKRARRQ